MAAFLEEQLFIRSAELVRQAPFRRVTADPWPETKNSEAIRHLRQIAGDLNLWLQIAPQIEKGGLPCNATDVEMLAVFALWKGQCQGQTVSKIVGLIREGASLDAEASAAEIRQRWATLTVEITQRWEVVADLGAELSRAATLATALVDRTEATRRAGRAGADKRALAYLPARERAQALYRQGSYRSRNKAAEDIFRQLVEEDFKVAFSSVLSYLTDLDREIEASRAGNRGD